MAPHRSRGGNGSRDRGRIGALAGPCALVAALAGAAPPAYETPFFPGSRHDRRIPTPEKLLGFRAGERPAAPDAVARCLEAWAEASPRARLERYAASHEGRALHYLVVTSEANMRRIDEIRRRLAALADPRRLDEDEAKRIIETTPAVAWMAYAIHGDELSSTDAALAVAYHLVAGTSPDATGLLEELVVIIDPLMNPDGRARFLHQLEQAAGYVPNLDAQAMQHGGSWPWGRGNHYLFDMNRDWIIGAHPETRGRQWAMRRWMPQLVVDSHEMGPFDTYLFTPPREPINPYLPAAIRTWWKRFAADQAAAFDRFGWSYYTREWLEFWFPGYTKSWAAYQGAIGILYEQAGVDGRPLRRPDGTVLTYRESVHHHVVSTLANLGTLRRNRKAILADFLRGRRDALAAGAAGDRRTFLLVPGPNASRDRAFLDLLARHGIEMARALKPFTAKDIAGFGGIREAEHAFPAGTVLVSMHQPLSPLALALLDFDPRMSEAFLARERRELERRGRSRIYDTTAWSLPLAYDVDAYWSKSLVDVPARPCTPPPPPKGDLARTGGYGYAIDGADDASLRALAALFEAGIKVRVAEEGFPAAGRAFPRGSLLLRNHENGPDLAEKLRGVARRTGIRPEAIDTALNAGEGPDLGGRRFRLLARPRVAVLCEEPIRTTSYGFVWFLLDAETRLSMSSITMARLAGADLRRYNVLIVPESGSTDALRRALGPRAEKLRAWVAAGGTLIAVGSSAGVLTDPSLKLTSVRLRRDVLDGLDAYRPIAELARDEKGPKADAAAKGPANSEARARRDAWLRRFAPRGAILRAEADLEHWLTFGCRADVPVFVRGSYALMARDPVAVPLRFAPAERLRLSGLLWPEAAERLAGTAYATVERKGHGQVILFAFHPAFRALFRATARVLLNAVLIGPGAGASQPVPW